MRRPLIQSKRNTTGKKKDNLRKKIFVVKSLVIVKNFRNGNGNRDTGYIQLEQEVLSPLAGTGKMFALQTSNWWSQLKTAGSAIYANRHYLELYKLKHPDRLYTSSGEGGCTIIPDVHIDPTAYVHPTAVVKLFYIFCDN